MTEEHDSTARAVFPDSSRVVYGSVGYLAAEAKSLIAILRDGLKPTPKAVVHLSMLPHTETGKRGAAQREAFASYG